MIFYLFVQFCLQIMMQIQIYIWNWIFSSDWFWNQFLLILHLDSVFYPDERRMGRWRSVMLEMEWVA